MIANTVEIQFHIRVSSVMRNRGALRDLTREHRISKKSKTEKVGKIYRGGYGSIVSLPPTLKSEYFTTADI